MEFKNSKMNMNNYLNQSEKNNTQGKKRLVFLISVLFLVGIGIIVSLFFWSGNINFKNIFPSSVSCLSKKENNSSKQIVVEEESATISAVQKVSPSVVSIIVSKDLNNLYNITGPGIFPFNDFFGFDVPNYEEPENEESKNGKQKVGGGTGFIISDDGLILTNKHVVSDDEAEYTVITNTGKEYEAKVLASDFLNDIAILKIEEKGMPVVELGDSDSLQLGQTVIAIGNSLAEYSNTVTKGVVSGIGRKVEAGNGRGASEVLEEAIQTDAAINPGNSGGPLSNLSGQVIGINTAVNMSGQLIGFAIPINQAKRIIESVKKYGKIIRPFLGVRYILLNKQIAKENNLDVDYGALIIRGMSQTDLAVIPGSPADKADLKENDIIIEINGQKIDSDHSLAKELSNYNPKDEIELKVLHKGNEKMVKVILDEYEN
ncbi:S1C family serine protease [Patescibacteria group bacterium]